MADKKLSRSQINAIILGVGVAMIVTIILIFILTLEKPLGENYKPVYEYGGDFALQSYQGEISLADYQGKVVVMYFGFLNCTEACPLSMATIAKTLKRLTPEQREQVQVIFVSVDPKRDDLTSLEAFTKYYDDQHIIGITGSEAQIKALSEQYGVFFELVDLEGSGLGYTVDHSSRFYLINRQGDLVTTMSHSTTATELAAKIQQLLQQPFTPTGASSSSDQHVASSDLDTQSASPDLRMMPIDQDKEYICREDDPRYNLQGHEDHQHQSHQTQDHQHQHGDPQEHDPLTSSTAEHDHSAHQMAAIDIHASTPDTSRAISLQSASGSPLLSVKSAAVKPTTPGQKISSAYFTLRNLTDARIQITQITTDVAQQTEFHHMSMQDNKMIMRAMPSPTIAPHGELKLNAGGDHVMLIGLKRPLQAQDQVTFTLTLNTNEHIRFQAPVVAAP